MPQTGGFTGTLTPWSVGYRPHERSPWKPFSDLRTDDRELCAKIARQLSRLIRYRVAVLRNGQPDPQLNFDPEGTLHPAEIGGTIRRRILHGLPPDESEEKEVTEKKRLLSIRDDEWSVIRRAVIQRMARLANRQQPIGHVATPIWLDLLPKAAALTVDNPNLFSQLRSTQVEYMIEEARIELRRLRMPFTAAQRDREKLMDKLSQTGTVAKVPQGAKARITVVSVDGRPIAIPPQGIAAINMGDDEEAYRKEARFMAATAEETKKAPSVKVMPYCQCGCGEQTSGGKFRPGHDAKLKSRLVNEFRSDDEEVSQNARQQLNDLGWGQYATPPPEKKKTMGRATRTNLGKGNHEVRLDSEDGELLQKAANDEAAMTWADDHGYEVIETTENATIVSKIEDEDEEEEEEEDDSDDDDDE